MPNNLAKGSDNMVCAREVVFLKISSMGKLLATIFLSAYVYPKCALNISVFLNRSLLVAPWCTVAGAHHQVIALMVKYTKLMTLLIVLLALPATCWNTDTTAFCIPRFCNVCEFLNI